MEKIILNTTTVNEMLRIVRDMFNITDLMQSTLEIQVYYKHALERCKIGTWIILDMDNVGEFVLESTVRQYDMAIHTYRDGSMSYSIKVVINER